ncbi:hypothetical protein EKK58_04815 [Candidatus Dependentiae bacterium]|nr:MAG: hypothetical protein EKK58_04815 [Candidatus Dependentiae bacterium]
MIISKINKGSIILNVPVFSMQDIQIMVFCSHASSFLTISLFFFCMMNLNPIPNNTIGYFFTIAAYFFILRLFNNTLAEEYACFYDKRYIPWFISQWYNPYFITPAETASIIRRHLQCPVLVHISKNDELLSYTKYKIKHFFNHFLGNLANPYPTVLLLSEDHTHDQNNTDFQKIKNEFLQNPKDYFPTKNIAQINTSPKFVFYDSTLEDILNITYKDSCFPLIS